MGASSVVSFAFFEGNRWCRSTETFRESLRFDFNSSSASAKVLVSFCFVSILLVGHSENTSFQAQWASSPPSQPTPQPARRPPPLLPPARWPLFSLSRFYPKPSNFVAFGPSGFGPIQTWEQLVAFRFLAVAKSIVGKQGVDVGADAYLGRRAQLFIHFLEDGNCVSYAPSRTTLTFALVEVVFAQSGSHFP
ncbi:hypothetical protein BASA81_011065 [Batrachochytrium salamandrivorans]|nr:hypothetical protein BASA81_011065 [Batrachochytrium salamandrivorans]